MPSGGFTKKNMQDARDPNFALLGTRKFVSAPNDNFCSGEAERAK